MTDVKVEQCDRVAAHAVVLRNLIAASGSELPWMREALADILDGKEDEHYMVQAFARHRQAAEKATRERDAKVVEIWDKVGWSRMHLIDLRIHIATAIRSQNDD